MRKDVYCSVCSIFPAPLRSHPLVCASSLGSDEDLDSPCQTSPLAVTSRKSSRSGSGLVAGPGSGAASGPSSLKSALGRASAAGTRTRSMAGEMAARSTSSSPMGTVSSFGSGGRSTFGTTRSETTSSNVEHNTAKAIASAIDSGSGSAGALDSARGRERTLARDRDEAVPAANGSSASTCVPIPRYALSTLDELSVNKYNIRVRDLTRAPAFATGEAATLPVERPWNGRVANARAVGVDDCTQNSDREDESLRTRSQKRRQMPQSRLVRSPRQALHEPETNGREDTATDARLETLVDATCGRTMCTGASLVGLNWREYSGDCGDGDGVYDANSTIDGDLTMLTLSSGDGGRDELRANAFQRQHVEDAWLAQLAPSALDATVAIFNENSFGFSAIRVRVGADQRSMNKEQ